MGSKKQSMQKIQNTLETMVWLWRRLACAERELCDAHKRFCPRSVLRQMFGLRATDDFVWEVCMLAELEGFELLNPPRTYPRRHRELLRAVVAVRLGIGMRNVNLKALDAAYSEVFPHSTPLNVNRRRSVPPTT